MTVWVSLKRPGGIRVKYERAGRELNIGRAGTCFMGRTLDGSGRLLKGKRLSDSGMLKTVRAADSFIKAALIP